MDPLLILKNDLERWISASNDQLRRLRRGLTTVDKHKRAHSILFAIHEGRPIPPPGADRSRLLHGRVVTDGHFLIIALDQMMRVALELLKRRGKSAPRADIQDLAQRVREFRNIFEHFVEYLRGDARGPLGASDPFATMWSAGGFSWHGGGEISAHVGREELDLVSVSRTLIDFAQTVYLERHEPSAAPNEE